MASGALAQLIGVALFLIGVALVIWSVETFVEAVAESALVLGMSGFFLTVLLAGTDLENAVLGVAAVVDGLSDLALGTVFGEALFVLGAAVGLAGALTPFETDVPRAYLLLMLAAPSLFLLLALDGSLSRLDGVALTLAYLPLLGAVYAVESRTEMRYLAAEAVEAPADGGTPDAGVAADGDAGADGVGGDEADGDREGDDDFDLDLDLDLDLAERSERLAAFKERREGWYRLSVAVLATVGMTVGSELAVSGARTLLDALAIGGLAFGATVMSFIASLEELFLTLEPVRRGRPHLGVGNVVGSTLFFVTANAGLIALVGPIDTGGTVASVHGPFFVAALALAVAVLWRGRVGRASGVALLGLYAAYFVAVLGGDLNLL